MESKLLNDLAARGCAVMESLEETFMGNEAFYVKMLAKLPTNDAIVRMESALAVKDAKALFEASHELKGLYGTMGLTPNYTRCCEIVEIARAGGTDGVAEKLVSLKAMHAETVALIQGG